MLQPFLKIHGVGEVVRDVGLLVLVVGGFGELLHVTLQTFERFEDHPRLAFRNLQCGCLFQGTRWDRAAMVNPGAVHLSPVFALVLEQLDEGNQVAVRFARLVVVRREFIQSKFELLHVLDEVVVIPVGEMFFVSIQLADNVVPQIFHGMHKRVQRAGRKWFWFGLHGKLDVKRSGAFRI